MKGRREEGIQRRETWGIIAFRGVSLSAYPGTGEGGGGGVCLKVCVMR